MLFCCAKLAWQYCVNGSVVESTGVAGGTGRCSFSSWSIRKKKVWPWVFHPRKSTCVKISPHERCLSTCVKISPLNVAIQVSIPSLPLFFLSALSQSFINAAWVDLEFSPFLPSSGSWVLRLQVWPARSRMLYFSGSHKWDPTVCVLGLSSSTKENTLPV